MLFPRVAHSIGCDWYEFPVAPFGDVTEPGQFDMSNRL